jgi:hypothetical protein
VLAFVEWSCGCQSVTHKHLAIPSLDVVERIVSVFADNACTTPHGRVKAVHTAIYCVLPTRARVTQLRMRERCQYAALNVRHDFQDFGNAVGLPLFRTINTTSNEGIGLETYLLSN